MNVDPMMAVDTIQIRKAFIFPRFKAEYAKTMLILLIKSTKVLTDVTGMSNTSIGKGPERLLP